MFLFVVGRIISANHAGCKGKPPENKTPGAKPGISDLSLCTAFATNKK